MRFVKFLFMSLILFFMIFSHSTATAQSLLRIENNQLFVNHTSPIDITLTSISWGPIDNGSARVHLHTGSTPTSHGSCPRAFGNWEAGKTAQFPYFLPNQEIILGVETLNTKEWFITGPASRNPDNKVHATMQMVEGSQNEITIGFEHSLYGGDQNFTDTVITVTATAAPQMGAIDPNTHFMGMNLGSYNYFSKNFMFVDAMKSAKPFVTQNSITVPGGTNPWDSGVISQIPADENGYPLALPYDVPGTEAPQVVATLLFRLGGDYPGGIYTLLYDGTGKLSFNFDATMVHEEKGKILLNVTPSGNGFLVKINESEAGDHIRNIRIIMPGFENTYQEKVFNPELIERLQGFHVVRFMELQVMNKTIEKTWQDRTPFGFYTQGSENRGVALEYIIDLTNRINSDPWISVPHLADDTYVREMARLIRDRLDPLKKVYIEYSNELWNGMFPQARYIQDKGCELGLENDCYDGVNDASDAYWSGVTYSALRSAQIFKIFEEEFNGSDRLINVLGGAAVFDYRQDVLLTKFNDASINPHQIKADALAIAPYFAEVANEIGQNNEIDTITVDEILNRAEKSISKTVLRLVNNKKVADRFGIPLIAYEGGQHLVATGNYQNNEVLTEKLAQTNRHPRMKALHDELFRAWFSYDGGLFCFYRFISHYNKYGSWGVFESLDQPIETAPKFQAILPYITHPNTAPIVNGGDNLIIESRMQSDTVLTAEASDPDGDPIYYQWHIGNTPLADFLQVAPDGLVRLALSSLNPLALGDHTITLVVKDDLAETRDDLILTIGNSKPNAVPVGAGTYEVLTPITLKGEVSDYDGDVLSYEWFEMVGTQKFSFYTGNITAPFGGGAIELADMTIPEDLSLGDHTIYLEVSDGVTAPQKKAILIKVVDSTAPTLAPIPNTSLIWPPNHKMVDIIIQANADDNSGSVTLGATVSADDPSAEKGVDYTTPEIFQESGEIHLKVRAERPGKGNGRTYTVVVTATDASGNASVAKVDIVCPHDKKRK